jgi:hypothetical protein
MRPFPEPISTKTLPCGTRSARRISLKWRVLVGV